MKIHMGHTEDTVNIYRTYILHLYMILHTIPYIKWVFIQLGLNIKCHKLSGLSDEYVRTRCAAVPCLVTNIQRYYSFSFFCIVAIHWHNLWSSWKYNVVSVYAVWPQKRTLFHIIIDKRMFLTPFCSVMEFIWHAEYEVCCWFIIIGF